MMEAVELSIIIPVYNVAIWLPQTVDNVLAQTFRKYIDEYKEFRPWLRKNCRFSKVQRGLLEAFPAMPELALKLYHYLTR